MDSDGLTWILVNSASADGNVAELAGQDGGTTKKVHPTQVHDQMRYTVTLYTRDQLVHLVLNSLQ